MLTSLILLALVLIPCQSIWAQPVDAVTVISEDFEPYLKADVESVSINDQGPWKSSPYGKPAGLLVARSTQEPNLTNVLTAAGGGDHHARLLFEPKLWEQAVTRQAWCLELSSLGGADLIVGINAAYNPKPALHLRLGKVQTVYLPEKEVKQSLNTFATDKWLRVRIIMARDLADADQLHLWVATRPLEQKDALFVLDPALTDILLPIKDVPLTKWTGIKFRMDSRSHLLDDIQLQAVDDANALLKDCDKGQAKVSFGPLLDYIALPRKALDLGGIWQLAHGPDNSTTLPDTDARWQQVIVPGDHVAQVKSDPTRRVWFRREVMIPDAWAGNRVQIHCERITDQCDIRVNGQHVGHSDEGILPFAMDITDAIKPGQRNMIDIGVLSTWHTGETGINQPEGWSWYYPQFTGIPLPVHLEAHQNVYVSDVYVKPMIKDGTRLETQVTITNQSSKSRTIVVGAATQDGSFKHTPQTIMLASQETKAITLADRWDNPRLWWPHDPHLYQLQINVRDAGKLVDTYVQRMGFREMRVEGSQLVLNGVPFMHRRNSIIPYLPIHQRDVFEPMVAKLKSRGFNGSRLHGGPSLRLVRMADELGWLITPESAINEPRGHQVTDAYWPRAKRHALDMVHLLRNNPSVIYWSLSNEFGSNYMPSGDPKGPWVDNWLNELGQDAMRLDPTRTVTFSGDIDLGGRGHSGPAPTLSFHYAWQPFKLTNMIPATRHWLAEGKKPWQDVAWDQTKPVILSEDMYQPYSLKPPYGTSQWGGNDAYDPDKQGRVIFDAYRMLAEGYYEDGVAGWNPWGTSETRPPGDAIYVHGQLMPDYLIATEKVNQNFASGEQVDRNLRVYNKLFEDQQVQLEARLIQAGNPIATKVYSFKLPAGQSHALPVKMDMPSVEQVTEVRWQLRLIDSQKKLLSERTYNYSVFPEHTTILPIVDLAVVGDLPLTSLRPCTYSNLGDALAKHPRRLVLSGVAVSPDESKQLENAVKQGLQVIWIEAPSNSWLPAPLKIDSLHRACFAFINRSGDALMQGLSNTAISLWGTDTLVVNNAFHKPTTGVYEVLASCGDSDGLTHTPLLRWYAGTGSYLFCQMPIFKKYQEEPAAREMLWRLLITESSREATGPLAVLATGHSSMVSALNAMHIPFVNAQERALKDTPAVLMVDASYQADQASLNLILEQRHSGRTVWLQRLTAETANGWLEPLGIAATLKTQDSSLVSLRTDEPLLTGLDNDDLYWQRQGKDSLPIIHNMFELTAGTQSLNPAGLLVQENIMGGTVICSEILWDEMAVAMPDRCERIIRTMLGNAGVSLGNGQVISDHWLALDLASACNRGYEAKVENGWFGKLPDLTYFPVNRTGIDPMLNVPQPPESFTPMLYSDNVPFKLTDPQINQNRGAIVVGRGTAFVSTVSVSMPSLKAQSIWMLGATRDSIEQGEIVANLQMVYSNGKKVYVPIRFGIEVGAFGKYIMLPRGRRTWSGPAKSEQGKYVNACLYAWSLQNPHPQWDIQSMCLVSVTDHVELGVVAMTLQQAD
jgi:hypothetical protein